MVAAAVFMAVKRAQLIMLLDAIGTGYAGVLVGLIVCALASMVFISAPSISLEGKSLWVMQTMPIRGGTVLRAKAAMHIMITAPAAVLCTAAMGIILEANALDCIAAALLAVAFTVFTAYFGVALNLKFHRFDWINETAAVKSGMSVMLAMFGSMAILAIPALLYALLAAEYIGAAAYMALWAAIFAAVSMAFDGWFKKHGDEKYAFLA